MADDEPRCPEIPPDDEAYAPLPAPILQRINDIPPEAQAKFGEWYQGAQLPGIAECTWPQLRQIAATLRAGESATFGPVDAAVRQVLIDSLEAMDAISRSVAVRAIANYGIGHVRSLLLTRGEVDTAMYVLTHCGEVWKDARELGKDAIELHSVKPFEEAAADEKTLTEVSEHAEKLVKANAAAPLEELTDHDAPVDYDDPVPHGAVSAIMDWVTGSANDDADTVAQRSHRAMIAEIRRRGVKQRKGLIKSLGKKIPPGWLAPYLRADLPDADTLPHPLEVAEGQALHIVVTSAGVRYWQEETDA